VKVQGWINLHKPKERVINASWSQNGAWMKHKQIKLTRHIMAQTWKGTSTSSPIIYFVTDGGGLHQNRKKSQNS